MTNVIFILFIFAFGKSPVFESILSAKTRYPFIKSMFVLADAGTLTHQLLLFSLYVNIYYL